MSGISSVGTGVSLTHLNLLQDDNLKDDKTRALQAAKQGDRTSLPADSTSATDIETAASPPNDQLSSQDDLLTKINTLITNELGSGKLSADRAAALRNVFSNAFTGSAEGETKTGTGAPQAVVGADASITASGVTPADVSSRGQSSPAGNPSTETVSHDVGSVLNDFLKLLQDAKSTASTYGASGVANAELPASNARLINYRA